MSQKIKQEDGTEIEVFTTEELEEAKTSAIETNNQTRAQEIDKLATELKAKEEELVKLKGKDLNFSNLREINDRLTKEVGDLKTQISIAIGGVKKDIETEAVTTAITSLAGDDKEVEKKIKFHFETTLKAVEPKNKEELNKKIQDAYLLATGEQVTPLVVPGTFSSAGAGINRPKINQTPLSPAAVEVGKKMGITDEDVKKYDKQDFSKTK